MMFLKAAALVAVVGGTFYILSLIHQLLSQKLVEEHVAALQDIQSRVINAQFS